MTIAALITTGIGPGSTIKFVLTGGLDNLAAAAVVAVTTTQKRPGPFGGVPQRYVWPPPGWKKKKPSLEEVKELYLEARKIVPPREQRGLLPVQFRYEGHSDARLPPARIVDFGALRNDLSTLRGLLQALAEYQEKEKLARMAAIAETRRIRDEEVLIFMLMNM